LQVQGVLYLELKVRQKIDLLETSGPLAFFQPLDQERTEGIVAAGGVAAGKHKHGAGFSVQPLCVSSKGDRIR
jgi:hypothetical protein